MAYDGLRPSSWSGLGSMHAIGMLVFEVTTLLVG